MVLRELADKEKAELVRIKTSKTQDSWQILMGMIAIDFLNDKINGKPVMYEQLVDCISNDYLDDMDFIVCKDETPTLPNIIICWIARLMNEHSMDKKKKTKNNLIAVTFGLMEAVCGIGGGMTGKKQMDMWKFYEETNERLQQETGHELCELSEETYRYIVTCLEYVGIKREPSIGEMCVDVSFITWNDIS